MDFIQIIMLVLVSVGTVVYIYNWSKQDKKFFWDYKEK